MKRPVKQKRNQRGESPEPTQFTRKDLLQVWGVIAIIFGIVGGFLAIRISSDKAAFAKSLDRTVDEWRETYHLTEEQARRIREIEFTYHGTGNSLTRPAHAREETAGHHAEIASAMNAEDGARFLKNMGHPQGAH